MKTTTEPKPTISGVCYAIATSLIEPDPNQPRKKFTPETIAALSESIKAEGLRQPISVRKNPDKPGHYLIVMGERRWRAHCHAGLQTVRCHVVTDCEDAAKRFRNQVIENKGREDMSLREDAFAAKQMTENGDNDETVARSLHLSVYRMRNVRRMTRLSEEVWGHIEKGAITPGIAEYAVSKLPDDHMNRVLLRCVGKNRKQAAAIVGTYITELNQANFELACDAGGFSAKKDETARQIALNLMAVAEAIGELDSNTRFQLARSLGDEVAKLVPQSAKIQKGAAFLQRLLNHVDTTIEMAKS